MADPDHLAVVLQGRKAVEPWREKRARKGESEVLDLGGADLHEKDLSQLPLQRANLENADLSGATLAGTNLSNANLNGADLRGADLTEAYLHGAELTAADLAPRHGQPANLAAANLEMATLRRACLDDAVLTDANLHGAELRGATARRAVFDRADAGDATLAEADLAGSSWRQADLRGASFEKAILGGTDFFEAGVEGARFSDARDLRTAWHLTTVEGHPADFAACRREWPERYVDWEQISTFGRLRLLGVSYSALVLIIFYIFVLDFYNNKVAIARGWAERVAESAENLPPIVRDANQTLALELRDKLQPASPPAAASHLLASFFLLAIGSTLYQFRCPEEVKTFTRVYWCYALRHPLIHYWPLCWRDRWLRLVCFGCYVLGASLAIWLVVVKVGWVLWYLVTH